MSLGLDDLRPRRKTTSATKTSLKSNVARPWNDASALQAQSRGRRQVLDFSAVMNEEWLLISRTALPWLEITKPPRLLKLHNRLQQFESGSYLEWRETIRIFNRFIGFER